MQSKLDCYLVVSNDIHCLLNLIKIVLVIMNVNFVSVIIFLIINVRTFYTKNYFQPLPRPGPFFENFLESQYRKRLPWSFPQRLRAPSMPNDPLPYVHETIWDRPQEVGKVMLTIVLFQNQI